MAASIANLGHELRHRLNDEVHARPSDPIATPSSIVSIANLASHNIDEHERLEGLLSRLGVQASPETTKHLMVSLDQQRLRWERHTEFSRYAFVRSGDVDTPFSRDPLEKLPQDWLRMLEGDLLVAVHLCVVPMPVEGIDIDQLSQDFFANNTLIGSRIAGGRAVGLTDFRIREDGFTRILVLNDTMPDTQTGRYVQRLIEMEAYRMMALLALPVAQQLFPGINASEQELAAINGLLVGSTTVEEGELLERLTKLAAESERRHAASDYRLSAAIAYYDLVLQRNREMREERISGTQTFAEFATRRLTPAINTCRTVAERQQSLVARMARATQLLSTRIDVETQRQNSSILASLNRRMHSQLRLQATVEGLSVAAVTYYVVGLIGMLAESLADQGLPINKGLLMIAAIPLVAGTIYYLVRRVRHRIAAEPTE